MTHAVNVGVFLLKKHVFLQVTLSFVIWFATGTVDFTVFFYKLAPMLFGKFHKIDSFLETVYIYCNYTDSIPMFNIYTQTLSLFHFD